MTAVDTTRGNRLRRWLHSRGAMICVVVVSILCGYVAVGYGDVSQPPVSRGIVSGIDRLWQLSPMWASAIALTLNILIAALLCRINSRFNLLRTMTRLQGLFFLLMQIATPSLLVCLCPGLGLCLLVLVCMVIAMGVYDDPDCQRAIFVIFMLLSCGAAVDTCVMVYIPVFLLACVQVRVISLRTILAALMGLLTPWIIVLGFGLVDVDRLQPPLLVMSMPDLSAPQTALLMATVAFTIFMLLVALIQNVMLKYLSYNAMSRAKLSIVTVTTLVTLAAVVLDYDNIYSYLPLLNCCAALQLAHLFGAVYTDRRSYIPILILAAIYLSIFALGCFSLQYLF